MEKVGLGRNGATTLSILTFRIMTLSKRAYMPPSV